MVRSLAGQRAPAVSISRRLAADGLSGEVLWPRARWALGLLGRACCCPARPVVTVVMPPASARRHPVDLLLCGHHYRVCRAALTAAGATVYDETGALISTGAGGHELARPEPAGAAPRR